MFYNKLIKYLKWLDYIIINNVINWLILSIFNLLKCNVIQYVNIKFISMLPLFKQNCKLLINNLYNKFLLILNIKHNLFKRLQIIIIKIPIMDQYHKIIDNIYFIKRIIIIPNQQLYYNKIINDFFISSYIYKYNYLTMLIINKLSIKNYLNNMVNKFKHNVYDYDLNKKTKWIKYLKLNRILLPQNKILMLFFNKNYIYFNKYINLNSYINLMFKISNFKYYMQGDNNINSIDSKWLGFINKNNIHHHIILKNCKIS